MTKTLPPVLQERLDLILKSTPEELMKGNVRPSLAFLMGGLINSSIPGDELLTAMLVNVATIMAISAGQREDHGSVSAVEQEAGIVFDNEDLYTFHMQVLRHLYDHMLTEVKSEHMDMKAQKPAPTRTM